MKRKSVNYTDHMTTSITLTTLPTSPNYWLHSTTLTTLRTTLIVTVTTLTTPTMTPSAPPTPPSHWLYSTTKTNLTTPPTLHSYWLLATYYTQIHWPHDYSDYINYTDDMIALTTLTISSSSWLCLPVTTLTEYTISVTGSISLTTQTTQLQN